MTKKIVAEYIDNVETIMFELETSDVEYREEVIEWLTNLRDDINDFLQDEQLVSNL